MLIIHTQTGTHTVITDNELGEFNDVNWSLLVSARAAKALTPEKPCYETAPSLQQSFRTEQKQNKSNTLSVRGD